MVLRRTPSIPPAALNCSVSNLAVLTADASCGAPAPERNWTIAILISLGLLCASAGPNCRYAVTAIATATLHTPFLMLTLPFRLTRRFSFYQMCNAPYHFSCQGSGIRQRSVKHWKHVFSQRAVTIRAAFTSRPEHMRLTAA